MTTTPSMRSGVSENSEGLDQYATHWELSSLRMRTTTLSAENDALRSHVSQLQEQVSLLCEDLQPDGGVINEATAARIAALERELHQKLCDLDEASSQAEAVSSENVALRDELGRMQDRMHVLEQDCSATRARLQTLQQLYLKSSQTLPGPLDIQAFQELNLSKIIEPLMAAQISDPPGSPVADMPTLPPRDIVHALNEISALQKERKDLKTLVKKLEDKCGQLSRDKEELCQALTAVKKGQSVAAGPGQTRTLNLMRRVHSLAEQLKQKDEALAEKNAYVGKLEWRLLCQHKALEEKRVKGTPAAGKPPAREAQLTGPYHSPKLAIKQALRAGPQRSAVPYHRKTAPVAPHQGKVVNRCGQPAAGASVASAHDASVFRRLERPSDRVGLPQKVPEQGAHASIEPGQGTPAAENHDWQASRQHIGQPQESAEQAADENFVPGQRDQALHEYEWQAASKMTSRSLSGAFAESAQARAARTLASPLYVSRLQRQSRSGSQEGVVDQRVPMVPPSLTASPAVSEMVYSLPGTPWSHFSLADVGLLSGRATHAQGAAESAGSAAATSRVSGSGNRPAVLCRPAQGISGDVGMQLANAPGNLAVSEPRAAKTAGSAAGLGSLAVRLAQDNSKGASRQAVHVTGSQISLPDTGLLRTPAVDAVESAGSTSGISGLVAGPAQDSHAGASSQAAHAPADLAVIAGDKGPAVAVRESTDSEVTESSAGGAAIAYSLSLCSHEPAQAASEHGGLDEQSTAAQNDLQSMCNYEGQSGEGSRRQTDSGSRRQTGSSYKSCDLENPQRRDEELPVSYSGFSSDMRAAANATAESLFRQAEASSAGSSRQRHANHSGSFTAQEEDRGHLHASRSTSSASSRGAMMSAATGPEGDSEDFSVEELEQHIRALQVEIARSDAARAGGSASRQFPAEQTGAAEYLQELVHGNPVYENSSEAGAESDLGSVLKASYSMRWTLSPEKRP